MTSVCRRVVWVEGRWVQSSRQQLLGSCSSFPAYAPSHHARPPESSVCVPTFPGSPTCLYHPQVQGFSPRSGIIPLKRHMQGREGGSGNNLNPPRVSESTPGCINDVLLQRQSTSRWQNKQVPLLQLSRNALNPSVTSSTFPVSGWVPAAHSSMQESPFITGLRPQHHCFRTSVFG